MFTGTLEAIFIGPTKSQPMQQVDSIQAIAGAGLEGDRHSIGKGTFSKPKAEHPNQQTAADRQVTLIEAEALEAAARDYDLQIAPAIPRRNLLVRGVPLNHLVGRDFQIGAVRLRGIKLCEPCGHLEKMTVPGIMEALLHRGGLRAEILTSGTLHPGDKVRPDLAPGQ